MAGVCDQAASVAHNETALAKINPAAIRILSFLYRDRAPGSTLAPMPGTISCPKPSEPS
jgi:hypothetical protein